MRTTISALKDAAKKYADIRERIRTAIVLLNPVEVVTPINVSTEREYWLKKASRGSFTNPNFIYDDELLDDVIRHRDQLEKRLSELEEIECDDVACRFILDQLSHALTDGLSTTYLAESILNRNDDASVEETTNKYGTPSKKNVEDAYKIAANNVEKNRFEHTIKQNHPYPTFNSEILSKKKLCAREIKEIFEWTMSSYGGENWPVEINGTCTSIDVRDKSAIGHPIIVIPWKRTVTGFKLAELVGHEIECHWRSSINAETIGILKCDDEIIYEGLAALKDKAFKKKYRESFELNSAYYVMAINEALSGSSFAKTAALIYRNLPSCLGETRFEKTWTYTYRAFRGITNTKNPHGYAFTKDRAYFEGYKIAKELEEQGKGAYLSYSTLNHACFERFMNIIDIEDVERNAILDKNMQEKSLEKILRCIHYNGT